ncbi:MAG: peptidoglycan D,D-transpeptidase FtsI family protein [Planctomycetota bacterium]|jgi:cell division protein FtsI/penicillin-binding protein 2
MKGRLSFDRQSALPPSAKPLLRNTVQLNGRTKFVVSVMTVLWAAVAARLVQVQGLQSDELAQVATRQHQIEVEVPARPADIVDRNGKLLATTIVTPSLFVNPSRLDVQPSFLKSLAGTLDVDADHLARQLDRYGDKQFLWVKRRLTDEELDRVVELDWPDSSYGFRNEFLRQYPQGRLASHVLGLRNIDGAGAGGVEQSLNHLIQGRPGVRRLVRDAMGRIVEVSFDPRLEPQRFDAVQLTLDLPVQMFAEKALDKVIDAWQPTSACAIVMNPRSGDVLAMASRPTYSPNDLASVSANAWRNQAINIVYEPGSTFKPFVVAWALEHGVLKRDERFDCEMGEYRMGPRLLRDHHPYPRLSVTDILVKSSNIGMAKIGQRLANAGLYDATIAFGFGRPTGIELPGELSGLLRPLDDWNGYSTGSIPMGQELAVTPLQLITAHAALANGGRLVTPRILYGVQGQRSDRDSMFLTSMEDPDVAVPAKIVTGTVPEAIADWVVQEPMVQVVERGTGHRARLAPWTVFGKTGTAQKYDPETGTYSETLYTSSFVCGAPAQDPKVLVLVVVDEPDSGKSHGGGRVAAPAAAEILQRTLVYLRVPPDRDTRAAAILPTYR